MHLIAEQVVSDYLTIADEEAPGLVEGLYLVGSCALGDFRPGASDVDFIAVTRAAVTDSGAVRRIHQRVAELHRRPFLDGDYVTPADLRHDPAHAAQAVGVHEHRVRVRERGCDPVAWHTLAHHGVTIRGPEPAALHVHADPAILDAWCRRNLDDYWRPWLVASRRRMSRTGAAHLVEWGPAWSVLGVSRLHYTLATGRITSKTGAGEHALAVFGGRWRRIVEECLRIRRGEGGRSRYPSPFGRRRDALDFLEMAIEAAHGV